MKTVAKGNSRPAPPGGEPAAFPSLPPGGHRRNESGAGGTGGWLSRFDRSRAVSISASLALVVAIGAVDYLTGYQLYFFAFYLVPVALAVWYVDGFFGILISVLCVAVWVAGDLAAGASYSRFVAIWNAMIALTSYFVVAGILALARSLHRDLEERVRQRTAALRAEMQERMRLEEEILRISEYEQRRIGHDLHDSLCQHLTGTALAGQVLNERLAAESLPEAAAAGHIVQLVEEAIEMTRKLARGLHPVDLSGNGLVDAFRELAGNVSERFKISCHFEGGRPAAVLQTGGSIHLYRIAQEAITNAIKHGKAREVVIRLQSSGEATTLTITDDGAGFPERPSGGEGMGLRIMAYRAGMIGARFNVSPRPSRGTCVSCTLPVTPAHPPPSHAPKNKSAAG